jgi:hypothetical protein
LDGSISVASKNKQTFLENRLELTLPEFDGENQVEGTFGSTLFFSDTRFGKEPFNSNSDFFRVGLEHLFPASQVFPNLGSAQNWWFGPTGSWLHKTENDYPVGTLQFVPEATRWAAGAILRHTGPKLTFTARLDHVWLEQDPIPAPGGTLTNLLSSTSCADATPVPVQGLPDATSTCADNGVRAGTHQDVVARRSLQASSFRDWQAVIGASLNF